MSAEFISISEFRTDAEAAGAALAPHGFRRSPELDLETPTVATVVFVGRNVAFTFTLDVRDRALDLVVATARNGKPVPTEDGGYSSSLYTHLLNRCGFRGRPIPAADPPPAARRARRVLSGLVNLLTQPCAAGLLSDRPDSLTGNSQRFV